MDTCTLSTAVYAVAHFCASMCIASSDGQRQFCAPASCPPSTPVYECVRPDGSKYEYEGGPPNFPFQMTVPAK